MFCLNLSLGLSMMITKERMSFDGILLNLLHAYFFFSLTPHYKFQITRCLLTNLYRILFFLLLRLGITFYIYYDQFSIELMKCFGYLHHLFVFQLHTTPLIFSFFFQEHCEINRLELQHKQLLLTAGQ